MSRAGSRVVVWYLLFGVGWILTTDWLLVRLVPEELLVGQLAKGMVFVGISSVLLWLVTAREGRLKREAAEARQAAERRSAAMARFEAIGQLTGGVAHDFNNLLTAIRGNVDAYLDGWPEDQLAPPELEEVRRSAKRGVELTRQLLAFGRRQVMHVERVDLNGVIEGMSALLDRLLGPGIRIRTDLDPELPPVEVDPGRIEQVVMNLGINARDAMPEGGEILLATTLRTVTPAEAARFPFPFVPGTYVCLEVADTGVGMDEAVQARIFEPFFTTKPKDVGTGLGLSTVYGIVKQSRGYVSVRSAPGEGTRFSVFLPRANSQHPEQAPDDKAPRPARVTVGSETVLVVEDDAAVRAVIVRALQRQGYAVTEAADGPEALRVLGTRSGGFDLVVTDSVMPDMTGRQLIQALRLADPRLRVLLISGNEADPEEPAPHLAKPFTADELVDRVREVLDA
jgi:signal transduction histidine kinase